ncbi:SDR family NAD(P)-dependent oxidoreductase [Erythrobacter sp. YT30]|uniref:SDR family NAD(P)-dependent oxidoreductase n=1 Tax=Erythrobacter sp. YT30 TaxID=1735012 RepID=UPI00076DAA17|nr:SDR family oxidoreductase [Erythrobacter sp. YT30]KWV93264.1 3-oxoacyl-ACP reductase [Erythrobacter sp. YT30]
MDLGLEGKKVVISAATRGVGLVTARTFLEEGAEVAICGRRPGKGGKFTPGFQGEGHPLAQKGVAEAIEYLSEFGTAHGDVVDCADSDAVSAWVEKAANQMGGIDVVVSNASALGGRPNTRESWELSFNVDLMSSVASFEAALPWFRKAGGGAFVQTGSAAAIEDHPFGENLSYAAMKAALINTVHQLAHRHMAEGIRCNTVCPGPTFIEDGSWDLLEDYMPDYYDHNKGRHPAGRFGKPEEIANAIVFLASEKASWIMGENLTVDGGYTTHVKY